MSEKEREKKKDRNENEQTTDQTEISNQSQRSHETTLIISECRSKWLIIACRRIDSNDYHHAKQSIVGKTQAIKRAHSATVSCN